MLKIIHSGIILLSIMLCATDSFCAALYRWQNGKGQMHYSSTPPTTPVKNLEVKRNNRWYPYSATSSEMPAPAPTQTSKTVISYNKYNAMIIIQARVNNQIERPFAVDTGASYTIISQELATALNLTPNSSIPPITLQTANGPIQVPLVNLKAVTVGSVTAHNVTAVIHELQDSVKFAGLLGLSFLDRFRVTVDAVHNQLTLESLQASTEYANTDCVAARELLMRGQALNDYSEEEASYYRQAIEVCPDFIDAYYALGMVYYQQKAFSRAIDIHRKILEMQPDEPQAHYRLGVLYFLERNFELARSEFEKTLRLDPNHQYAREHLEQLKNY